MDLYSNRLKIAVIAHGLHAGGGQVVGVNILSSIKEVNKQNEFYFILPNKNSYREIKLEEGGHKTFYYNRRFGHLGRWFFDTFILKPKVIYYKPDIILGLGNLALKKPTAPQAVLVLLPYLFYNYKHLNNISLVDKLQINFICKHFRKQLDETNLIFVQTNTIKKRLLEKFQYSGKIVVIGNAILPFKTNSLMTNDIPRIISDSSDKFKIFYLTRYYPHKGLEFLVDMVDLHRNEFDDIVVIITIESKQGKGAANLLREIKKKRLDKIILNAGPLCREELPLYYNNCDCLFMPTRFESFSSTYLEAMYFDMPILTSNLDFAHEICGDAALYFNPWDISSAKDAIIEIKNDSQLRNFLVIKGKRHLSNIAKRSWDEIACDMVNKLESLGGR